MRHVTKKKPRPSKKSNSDNADMSDLIAAWARGVVKTYYRTAV